MSRRNPSIIEGLDWVTFALYLSLISVGWLMIYTVGFGEGYPESRFEFLFDTTVGKQSFFVLFSLVLMFLVFVIEWKFWRTFAFPIYGFFMFLLLVVLIFGSTIKGSTSWFSLPGGFTLQPSEFAKFGACLGLASYLSTYSTDLRKLNSQMVVLGIILLPIALILLQPDAGSALIFSSFFILLFRKGMPAAPYVIGIVLFFLFVSTLVFSAAITILIFLLLLILLLVSNLSMAGIYHFLTYIILAIVMVFTLLAGYTYYTLGAALLMLISLSVYHWLNRQQKLGINSAISSIIGLLFVASINYSFYNILKPHQRDRLNVWLNPDKCDPQGSLYNVLQSKLAIGSGGITGKGFLQGTLTKLNYVPEQSTDFIFCTIGEEQGLIGSIAIIILFSIFIIRLVILAERQKSDFSMCFIYGLAGILFTHVFINIGMTMGLVPIIGIPLPFISYGGSSMLAFSLMVAVALKMDSHRYSV